MIRDWDMMTETESAVMSPEDGGRGHDPRNPSSL